MILIAYVFRKLDPAKDMVRKMSKKSRFRRPFNNRLVNRDNLMQHIQMQLSQKEKKFSEFFSAFLKSRLNFENF